MSDAFIGEIRIFAGDYAPVDWMFCQGQLLPVSQYSALFAVIGTYYGGDGRVNFALPNLCGRMPVGTGNNGQFPPLSLGQMSGQQNITLTQQQLPQHSHLMQVAGAATNPVNAPTSANNVLGASAGQGPAAAAIWSTALNTPVSLNPQSILPAGGAQPLNIQNPYLAISFIICTNGLFPPRQ